MDNLTTSSQTHGEATEGLIIQGAPMAANGKIEVRAIPLNKIKISRNSRTAVSKEELSGLMQSIKEVGLLQAIGVVKNGSGYEIIYGNRRFLACSKLGISRIPAFIHEAKKESDKDLKNLTENVQRRDLSLSEVGRYIALLKDQKLTIEEIGVRLGVNRSYVAACVQAYNDVPDKYKNDLEIAVSKSSRQSNAKAHGKIAVTTAKAIVSAKKAYGLTTKQTEQLFEAAKGDSRFLAENSRKYALAIKDGAKDPIGAVKPLQHVRVQFWVEQEYWDELKMKHVDGGNFLSMNGFVVAILRGQKAIQLKIKDIK